MRQDTDRQFESHRASLLALAYRMLGDLARAEDIVQRCVAEDERLPAGGRAMCRADVACFLLDEVEQPGMSVTWSGWRRDLPRGP